MTDLAQDHVQIRSLASALARFLGPVPPDDIAAFAQARWRMARVCIQHMACDDAVIYYPLERGTLSLPVAIKSFGDITPGKRLTAFRKYMKRWTFEAIQQDWTGYVTETARLLAALRDQALFEEKHLYPLLLVGATWRHSAERRLKTLLRDAR